MEWNNISSSYQGKQLRTIVNIDDSNVAKVTLYFTAVAVTITNKWGVSFPQYTGEYEVTLHVSKMEKLEGFLRGGIGTFQAVSEPVKRRTLKQLEDIASTLTVDEVLALAAPQTTAASII